MFEIHEIPERSERGYGAQARRSKLSAWLAAAKAERKRLQSLSAERGLTETEEQEHDAVLDYIEQLRAELAYEDGLREARGLSSTAPLVEGRSTATQATIPDVVAGTMQPEIGPTHTTRRPTFSGGDLASGLNPRTYAALFGRTEAQLANDGFPTFNDYFAAVQSGRHHPQLRAAMTVGVPSEGGYLVPEQYGADLLDGAMEDEIVRPRADVHGMTTKTMHVGGFDNSDHSGSAPYGVAAAWAAEDATSTAQKAKTREIQLQAEELRLYVAASAALAADGLDFNRQLGDVMRNSVSWGLDDAFLTGNGSGKPMGVLNDPALVSVAKEGGQAADTINYTNLSKMLARLHPASFKNSIWVASSTTIPQLLALTVDVGTGGSHIPVLTVSNGEFRILTRPAIFTEKVPALGDEGDILLADFSQYVIGLRQEIVIESSAHAGWYRNEMNYRVVVRVDGQGKWSGPFTPKNGDTQSWCVTLAERA